MLSRAAEVGEVLGLNKEKRLIDLAIGVTNNYKWKGTAYNTFYTSAGGGPWINELAGNELVDWTDVDAAEQLFADVLDPNTGEPVLVQPNTLLVMPAYRHAARAGHQRGGDPLHGHAAHRRRPIRAIRLPTTAWPTAGLSIGGSSRPAWRPTRPRNGGSLAIFKRLLPTWKIGRSRSRNRRWGATPISTRTSSCDSRPASAAPPR